MYSSEAENWHILFPLHRGENWGTELREGSPTLKFNNSDKFVLFIFQMKILMKRLIISKLSAQTVMQKRASSLWYILYFVLDFARGFHH